jgi:hypothetical protein
MCRFAADYRPPERCRCTQAVNFFGGPPCDRQFSIVDFETTLRRKIPRKIDSAGEHVVNTMPRSIAAVMQLGIALVLSETAANAQTIIGSPTIALKSGESTDVGPVYWISHCKSLLKSPPEVEILDGPSAVTATIREEMVLPRYQNCASKIPGGTLVLAAKEIEDPSYTRLTVRVTFKTRDGDRKFSQVFNLSLFP